MLPNATSRMQSSTVPKAIIISKRRMPTFKEYCKRLNIIHHSTRGKYKDIELQWKQVYSGMLVDMRMHNLVINNGMELITYIQEKLNTVPNTKKFSHEYILQELTNYSRLAKVFQSQYKEYIMRLKGYAKARQCTTINEVKSELNRYLARFSVDENSKNTYTLQNWLIIARYICDYLEEYASVFNEPITLFAN